MADDQVDENRLSLKAIFGFCGHVLYGLKLLSDGLHFAFPFGDKVVVKHIITKKQKFLTGHTHTVSCLHVSHSGKYVASGQLNHMGFRGYVILWDYAQMKEIARHDLHKVNCESVRFTAEDRYVVSIGGIYDGYVIVLDVAMRKPICRSVAVNSTSGHPNNVRPLNKDPSIFLVSGDRHLRMWTVDKEQRKLSVQEVETGRHQRQYTSMIIDDDDKNVFIGTMTGDVAHLRLAYEGTGLTAVLVGLYGKHDPRKPIGKDFIKYTHGIRDLVLDGDDGLIIGAGDGTIERVRFRKESFRNYPNPTWPKLTVLQTTKVYGAITSLSRMTGGGCLIGTINSEIFKLNTASFELKLIVTCHKEPVADITFPSNLSSVFATGGYESIRIWSMERRQELLRIMVHNFSCTSVVFVHDGSAIISGWNDGVIRAFTPISGKLIYAIPNAHNKGCSALAMSNNNTTLVSAGIEGQVRIWKIQPFRQSLIAVLKDHHGSISSLHFNKFNTEVISACTDGSCVIWDVIRMMRKQVICSNTQFTCARYLPDGTQILTSGSDGRLGYWMTFNGTLLRELEGSHKEPVNAIAFSPSGEYFAAVATDQYVKLWDFTKGTVVAFGQHTSSATSCVFSPCGKYFVSGSYTGAVSVWNVPEECWPKTNPIEENEVKNKCATKPRCVKGQKKENISGLEASRNNKDILFAECPPVDSKATPDINEDCCTPDGT